jgi:hypothetical protein
MLRIHHFLKMLTMSAVILLTACGTLDKVKEINVWPFGTVDEGPRVYRPANSIEYLCEKNKKFYVRILDNGGNVWLMLPEQEVLLPKVGNEKVYTNGISRLDMTGELVSLEARASNRYVVCKVLPIKAGN